MNMSKKIIGLLVIILILAPIVSYVYLENMFNSRFASEDEMLNAEKIENKSLIQKLGEVENLVKPLLVTQLGWYLHKSADPVNASRNTFTIYGMVQNVGFYPALNCNLTIQFYKNATLIQTSIIPMGDIYREDIRNSTNVNYTSSPYNNGFYYIGQQAIQCPNADSVTRIEITPEWS